MSKALSGTASAFVQVARKGEDQLTISLSVAGMESAIVVTLAADDWSHMLSQPGVPHNAVVHFEGR